VNLDDAAQKLKDVRWNKEKTSLTATCPLSNGVAHRVAVSNSKTKCLGGCADDLIGKFFANGSTGNGHPVSSPHDEEPKPEAEPPIEPEPDQGFAHDDPHFRSELEQEEILGGWKRRCAALARGFLNEDPEYHKPHLVADDLFDPILRNLYIAVARLPEYLQPDFLSATEIDEHLQAVVRWAVEDFLKRRHKNDDEEYGEEGERPEPPLKALDLGALYNLVDEWDRQPWVWEGILPRSSLSLIVGKSETGKSTLIYGLIYAIVRGLEFFGRKCEQGKVLYLAGDPVSEIVAGKTFRAMGLGPGEGIKVVAGALVGQKTGMQQLREWVKDFRPVLVVGDTLAATIAIDVDKYGQSYQVQQPLTQLAREFSPNFLMAHHSQKSAIDSYSVIDAALGSVGVAAVASSRMVTRMYRRHGKKFHTFEMSNLRIGQPLEGEWIVTKLESGEMVLDDLWTKRSTAMDQEVILKALEKETEPMAERTLWQSIFPKPKWQPFKQGLESLIEKGQIVVQKRKGRGGGKVYFVNSEAWSKNKQD
jgi:hypothetical protein